MTAPPGGALTRSARRFHRLSIRNKLLALVLLPLAVVLPLLGVLLLWWSSAAVDRLLTTKVGADLAVAHGYFERVLGEVGAGTAAVADSHALHRLLAEGEDPLPGAAGPQRWRALLAAYAEREGLDFIVLRHADRRARASSTGEAAAGEPLARFLAADTQAQTSVEVLEPAEQGALPEALRARVPIALLPTRNAVPTGRDAETRAMVLLSSHPVRASDGRLLGFVQGGRLLNRNLAFIDHINGIVYPEGSLPFGSRGTATLFLDDVRISTNVRLFTVPAPDADGLPGSGGPNLESGERAIGTRVSAAVREAVLTRGQTWLDRAFVVDEWYVSAYQPLRDGAGRAVGMLYVGYLERPFTLLKYAALASIGLIFFTVMLGAAWVSLRWARDIFHPLERMEATLRRVEAGDLAARAALPADAPQDEIGRLAGHLDRLLAVIDDNTRSLQHLNAELDAKVAERTAQLQQAQAHLVRNEKLAAVGQLTASIAHEVNNPIAVIQGNLDLMRELLDPAAAATVGAELRLVDEQIERMRLIVNQLLQFARPGEFAGYVEAVALPRLLDDCLLLVHHLLARTPIETHRELQATRSAAVNRQELQQVLVNLMVNAAQAMPSGGRLLLGTRDVDTPGAAGEGPVRWVEIEVADTGPGLKPEIRAVLFQPFTTGKKEGTGLGLWISRGLVERYGGDITASDRPGGGACFTVRLPAAAE